MTAMLEGIRVVEIGQNLSGPFAGEILADLGATVIKVEKPGGDDARGWGPPITEKASAAFHAMNRNKMAVTIDLAGPGGSNRLEALQAWSPFWPWDPGERLVRWMTSWATTPDDVDAFVAGVAAIVGEDR